MKTLRILSTLILAAIFSLTANAQDTSDEVQTIVPGITNVNLSWDGKTTMVAVRANNDYTFSTNKQWVKMRRSTDGNRLFVSADTTLATTPRTATVTLTSADGSMTRTLNITQEEEHAYETIIDKRIMPKLSSANTQQTGNGVDKLFDNNTATYWQSARTINSTSPAVITMDFSGTERIDYMVYTPRQESSPNGVWTVYTVTVTDHGKTYSQQYTTAANTAPDTIKWEGGIMPNKIEITISGSSNGYASGAELGFYASTSSKDLAIFADEVYSKLRPGVTQADINALTNPFCKIIAQGIFDGTYNTQYRSASYPCRLSVDVLSNEWAAPGKHYSTIDNPTGINFRTGDKRCIIVSGVPSDLSLQLCIMAWYIGKDGNSFDGADPHATYFTLHNGINVIEYTYPWDGLGYLQYYAPTRQRYEQGAPDIKVHFVNGEINGILTPDKTNEEMYQLCKDAAEKGNICIDVLGKKAQAVWTSAGMRDYCKASDGTSLGYRQYINLVDSLVHWEHRQIGFEKYGRIPDNHTLAYVNYQYYMFQGGWGVSFHHNQERRVLNCKTMMLNDYDAIWGFSHEWGHQHQMHPYACWGACSEVTNNIFSYYNVQHLGYVCDMDRKFITMFWDKNFNGISGYSQGRARSLMRKDAFDAAQASSSVFSWNKELRELCLAEADSFFTKIEDDPSRSVNIYETSLSINLTAFNILGNYATMILNYPDFYPDLFESLRRQEQPGGSDIEKKDGYDKYELISNIQNGNKGQLYSTFAQQYPNSCWVTHNYLRNGQVQWTDNSTPAVMCFVRKASRLYGYNLYDYFERAGFFRIGAFYANDYGRKWIMMTQTMLDEFKADMKALEDDGTLKPMTEQMLYDMFHVRNFNVSSTDKLYPTPKIPN